jgi:hypothetical protein
MNLFIQDDDLGQIANTTNGLICESGECQLFIKDSATVTIEDKGTLKLY